MKPVSESDHDLLETALDNALEPREAASLDARFDAEPELVTAMEQARAHRRLRESLWDTLEPDESAVDAFVWRTLNATRRRGRFAAVLRSVRYVAAAAACIVIGLLLRPALDRPAPTVPLVNAPNGVHVQTVASYEVTLRDDSGKVLAVQRFETIEKAQEFAADLARWQARQEKLASGRFVVTSDRF